MSRKFYLLTELEQEIIKQRRAFNKEIIKENNETWLKLNKENDDYVKVQMREKLARGESIIIAENMYPHRAPIDDIFLFFKRLLKRVREKKE